MGGEGGQALGDGLLVADVGENVVEDHHGAVGVGGDVEAALGHEGQEEADGLEGHRLAAGVGAGDDQGVKLVPQVEVVGHRLLGVQQRMAGLPQGDALLGQLGLGTTQLVREPGPGEDTVDKDEEVVVLGDVLLVGGALGRELPEDALDLLLLPGLELPELVVGLDHRHGLDEEGAAGAGHIVDQTWDLVLALRLHRHHVPAGAHGDDGLLEVLGLGGGDELLEDVTDLGGGGPDVPPDVGQLGAGGVGDLLLGEDGPADPVLQIPVGLEGGEEVVDAGLGVPLPGGVLLGGAGAAQEGGDVQQFPGVEGAPHVGPLEGGRHRPDAGEGRSAPEDDHGAGGGGLLLEALDVVGVGEGPQSPAPVLALLGGRLGGQ